LHEFIFERLIYSKINNIVHVKFMCVEVRL